MQCDNQTEAFFGRYFLKKYIRKKMNFSIRYSYIGNKTGNIWWFAAMSSSLKII